MLVDVLVGLAGSIFPTLAIIIVSRVTSKQIHRLDVKVNGRLAELLADAEVVGELRGRASEREKATDPNNMPKLEPPNDMPKMESEK